MRSLSKLLFYLCAVVLSGCSSQNGVRAQYKESDSAATSLSPFRGWDHLVERLREDGIPQSELSRVYSDSRMPQFEPIPFKLKPRESSALYTSFTQDRLIDLGADFLRLNKGCFERAEQRFKVNRYTVAAILLIETKTGQFTGNELVVNRLSRLAGITQPQNLSYNYAQLVREDPTVTVEQVIDRARYLDETFYPELKALFEISRREDLDLLELRGSVAGAFGIPQFLPRSYLKFAMDGNANGSISLFEPEDAVFSAANFLHSAGWNDAATISEKRRVIWKYNRSEAYIDTVLKVAVRLRSRLSKVVSGA